MPKKKNPRIPSLRHCNGRGFVELNGRRHYLGPWGAPETEEAYRRKVAEWLAADRTPSSKNSIITITELCSVYLAHCRTYYVRPDGTYTSAVGRARQAIKAANYVYGRSPANEFGPKALRTLVERWIQQGLARKTINDYTACLKLMFKWGTSEEYFDGRVWQALQSVEALKIGRSKAVDTPAVKPIPLEQISAIKPFLPRQVVALIDLQLLTGVRPGELLRLRPIDIDTQADVWVARLKEHKTSHIGRERLLYFGPKAQSILRKFITNRPLQASLFSPREAERERYARATTHRRPGQKLSPRASDRQIGECYSVASYRRSIARACKKAGTSVWTPHRLRHTSATAVRSKFGLEAAQQFLGHANAKVTEIYAETDQRKAVDLARTIG